MTEGVFQKKPERVQAMQFKGWTNAVEIQRFAVGSVFVPRGYEHHLRRENEYDRSNGHVYDDIAPPYLAVLTAGGYRRVDEGDWVVIDSAGVIGVCSDDKFKAVYEQVVL